MIQITKGPTPNILREHALEWRDRLLAHIAAGESIPDSLHTAYNQDEIKTALRCETHGKCMYCESKIEHISYAHIEHYKPKRTGKYPELAYEWTNLGLACQICNMNKGDEFDENHPFVNPYADAPNDYFISEATLILSFPGNRRAEITEIQLDLKRPELVQRRKERLNFLRRLVRNYIDEPVPALKAALKEEISNTIHISNEYSFCMSSHFNKLGLTF